MQVRSVPVGSVPDEQFQLSDGLCRPFFGDCCQQQRLAPVVSAVDVHPGVTQQELCAPQVAFHVGCAQGSDLDITMLPRTKRNGVIGSKVLANWPERCTSWQSSTECEGTPVKYILKRVGAHK